MKKTLLTISLLVSSVFFVYAQGTVDGSDPLGSGGNVGESCSDNGQFGTLNSQGACVTSQTGGTGNSGSPCSNNGQFGTTDTSGNCVTDGTGNTGAMGSSSNGLTQLLSLAQTVVGKLVPFLIGLALLAFFWFLIEFIWKGRESPEEQQKSVKGMGWSILALFVMVSIWGLIAFMGTVLGINQGGTMPGFKLPGEQ